MARGTFSHSKLKNVMKGLTKIGPFTIHHPSGVSTTIFEASVKYKDDQVPLVVIAGSNFGRGSARDWATKGPYLLGKYFFNDPELALGGSVAGHCGVEFRPVQESARD